MGDNLRDLPGKVNIVRNPKSSSEFLKLTLQRSLPQDSQLTIPHTHLGDHDPERPQQYVQPFLGIQSSHKHGVNDTRAVIRGFCLDVSNLHPIGNRRYVLRAKSEGDQLIGVYLPLSYQIGGYTIYLPRDRVKPVDMTVEEAMRLTLTGGMSGEN